MNGLYKIGFIGLGVMGQSMARHLLTAGYSLQVYNRTPAKAEKLVQAGAVRAKRVSDLAVACDVIITMVGYPADVEDLYLNDQGILAFARPGSFVIDMTTSSPALAIRIAQAAAAKGVFALDAPVSGGDVGAREARLAIMVGGSESAFTAMQPVLSVMGNNVIRQGEPGAGQHTKMSNQIAIAGNMMGVCEAIAYAQKAGLNPERVLDSIATGAAASFSLSNLAPRMLKGDFAPGFYVKHFIKDMRIALSAAEEMGLITPGLAQAKVLYEQLAEQGMENEGTQALYKLYMDFVK